MGKATFCSNTKEDSSVENTNSLPVSTNSAGEFISAGVFVVILLLTFCSCIAMKVSESPMTSAVIIPMPS